MTSFGTPLTWNNLVGVNGKIMPCCIKGSYSVMIYVYLFKMSFTALGVLLSQSEVYCSYLLSFHWLSGLLWYHSIKVFVLGKKTKRAHILILFYLVSLQSMEELERNHLLLVWATLIVFHRFSEAVSDCLILIARCILLWDMNGSLNSLDMSWKRFW